MTQQLRTSMLLTGDASGLQQAGRQGKTAMQGLVDTATRVDTKFTSAAASAEVFEQAIPKRQAFDQLRAGIDPVFAATQRLESGQDFLNQSYREGVITQGEYRQAMTLLDAQHQRSMKVVSAQTATMGRLGKSNKLAAGGTANLMAQWNDLGVMMMAGQNPLQMAVQQGTQINQVIGPLGARGAVKALGTSFMGMLSPINFVTIGSIAAGAAMVQWLTGSKEDAKTLEDTIKGLSESVTEWRDIAKLSLSDIRKEFGTLTPEITRMHRELEELKLEEILVNASLAGSDLVDSVSGGMRSMSARLDSLFGEGLDSLVQTDILALVDGLEKVGNAEGIDKQLDAINGLQRQLLSTTGGIEQMSTAQKEFYLQTVLVEQGLLRVKAAQEGVGTAQEIAKAKAEELLVTLSEENAVLEGIVQHGEDSVEVMRLRQEAARASFEEELAALDVSESLKDELRLAFEEGQKLSELDLGKGIRIGVSAAESLAEKLGISLGLAQQISDLDRTVRTSKSTDTIEDYEEGDPRSSHYKAPIWDGGYNNSTKRKKGGSGGAKADLRTISQLAKELDRLSPSYDRAVEAAERWREETLAKLDPTKAGYDQFATDIETVFNERLKKAYEDDLKRRDDWQAGVERGLSEVGDGMMSWADVSEDIFGNWSDGLEDQFANFKFEIGDLVDYTIEQFARLAYQKSVQPFISSGFDIISDVLGGLLTSHTGSEVGPGNITKSYQMGPTGPKLAKDERLGVLKAGQRVFTPRMIENGSAVVDALAAAAAQPSVIGGGSVININNYSSAKVEETQRPDGGVDIDIMDQVERAMAGRVGQGKGPLSSAIGSSFGIKRSFGGKS